VRELQASAQRQRLEMDTEIKRLTFQLQESTLLRSRDHEEARQRRTVEAREAEQAAQRSKRSAAEQDAVRTKMMQADEELRAAAQVESLLLTRTSQIVAELHDWVRPVKNQKSSEQRAPNLTQSLSLCRYNALRSQQLAVTSDF
jgi:hypothetical protein